MGMSNGKSKTASLHHYTMSQGRLNHSKLFMGKYTPLDLFLKSTENMSCEKHSLHWFSQLTM